MTSNARRNLLTVLLVAQCVCVVTVLAGQLSGLIERRWVQDDAYVSFRYAKNFVRGDGLVYNPGAYVEGYTNFLWTMLSAVPLAMGIEDPLTFMHVAGGVLWGLSYFLLLRLMLLAFAEGIWIAPLALVPLAYHWSFNMWFLSGMETPLVCFLTIAAVYFFARDPERHPRTLFWASLCGVLLTMTRPDGVVALVGLAAAGAICHGRRVVIERRWRAYVVLPLLPILFVYLPFNAWRIWYYGSFYPNTYYAKVAYLTFYERGWIYLRSFLQIYNLGPWLPFLPLGAVLAPAGATRRFLWAAFLVTGGVLFYVVRLGGDFMEWRFLTPVVGLAYPGIVVGIGVVAVRLTAWLRRHAAASEAPRGALVGWVAGLGAVLLLVIVTRGAPADAIEWYEGGHEAIALLRRYGDPRFDWRSAGKLFEQILPPETKVALTAAGMIPFFCDRPVLDLHGLTDPQIAREPIDPEKRGRTGHEHWLANHDKIRERGVDVILEWADPSPYPRSIVEQPRTQTELVSARLADGRYVDFIILNPATFDRTKLKENPLVVFHDSIPVADRKAFHTLRERFGTWRVIDSIDLETPESEAPHAYQEARDAGGHRGSWHTKFIPYVEPFQGLQLEDNGRRLPIAATWQVHDVTAGQPLVVIARYDHTRGGVYDLDVNDKRVPSPLRFAGGPERWDEAWLEVPAELLVQGTNRFRLVRRAEPDGDAELYYLWFLQPPAA